MQDIIEAHKSCGVSSDITKFESGGVTQYFIPGNKVEFLQLDTETADIISIVNGASRHYKAKDAHIAARHISSALTHTSPNKSKRNSKHRSDDNVPLRVTLLPCGVYVTLFSFKQQWTASCQGVPISDDWLVFIRSQLDRFGVSLGELNEQTTYTFLCTRKETSPAQQDAIYLVNEYSKNRERSQLPIPRVEQVQLSANNFLKFDAHWRNAHLGDIIRTYQRLAFNAITPIYSIDIRSDTFSWRILTDAGECVNQFETQNEHSAFYDFAIANQEQPYPQFYLNSNAAYNVKPYTKQVQSRNTDRPRRGRNERPQSRRTDTTLEQLLSTVSVPVDSTANVTDVPIEQPPVTTKRGKRDSKATTQVNADAVIQEKPKRKSTNKKATTKVQIIEPSTETQ